VLYLDIDNFDVFNEQEGRETGDLVVKALVKRLKNGIRGADSLSRFGGDDFVIVLRDLDQYFNVHEFSERMLAQINVPIRIGEREFSITCSIGISIYPDSNGSAEKHIRNASHALNLAKSSGRARCVFFSQQKEEQRLKSYEARRNLLCAVENNELTLFAQPQLDIQRSKLFGIEILVRWQSPEYGLVAPDDFLNVVKDRDVLEKVDRWVVDHTMQALEAGLLSELSENDRVAINLTPASLQSDSFKEWVAARMAVSSADLVKRIDFEILESDALENMDQVNELIDVLRSFGVTFSLDDFGTGYSSLSVFNLLPVEHIKIDRSFVSQMLSDDKNKSLVRAICEISKVYNRQLIAEGVETSKQAEQLLSLGCHVIQGYGIAKPMPIALIGQWIKSLDVQHPWINE
jgi:diguanylate cyclase (GGDEF)-like protein